MKLILSLIMAGIIIELPSFSNAMEETETSIPTPEILKDDDNKVLSEDLKFLKKFLYCRVTLEGDRPKKVSIEQFSMEEQASILNEIGTRLETHQSKEHIYANPIIKEDATYQCSISDYSVILFKRGKLLGPLEEVLDQERRTIIKKNAMFAGDASSGLGNTMYNPNVITNTLEASIEPGMSVLEIGAARGIETFKMLARGANVTAVDLSNKDISTLEEKTPPQFKGNLKAIVAKFPDELHFQFNNTQEKFDVIYMSHVAHYLTGEEFRTGLEKIASWLKPKEGRFYFQTLTPYANPYAWNMIAADQSLMASTSPQDEWPGYFSEEQKRKQSLERGENAVEMYNGHRMPDFGHPIHPAILERELKRSGFKILYIGYSSLTPSLAQRLSPLSYQQQETYVKRFVYPAPEKEIEEIEKILKESSDNKKRNAREIPWRAWLDSDADIYLNNFKNPNEPSTALASMDNVIVIACKECDTE